MKLSISNLAWETTDEKAVLRLLADKEVVGIEIAPSKVWPNWQGITPHHVRRYRDDLLTQGFQISALQAILFGYPNYRLFGSSQERRDTMNHLRFVSDLAEDLGAKVMVLGAPRNRDRGHFSEEEAFNLATEFFQEIGEYCVHKNTCLCIEPNPPVYQCNFITTSTEGYALVQAVNSEGFSLHLDAAGMYLAEEEIAVTLPQCATVLQHFHISEPNLSGFSAPVVDHQQIGTLLKEQAYQNWVSVEMRSQTETINAIETAINLSFSCY
jgi:sugar phosphate isomerase/epimerase